LIVLTAAVYLTARQNALDRMGVEQSPEVLSQKAREIANRLGYEERPADTASGFSYDVDFVDYVQKNDKPRPRWNEVLAARPSVLLFWYRQSPRDLVALDFHDLMLIAGVVDEDDPPPILSGMIHLQLDPHGRLTSLEAIPPEHTDAKTASGAFEWKVLFDAAGLDLAQFQPAQPVWNSLAAYDARAAWTGKWPGTTRDVHVEAAAFQGKPVFFSLTGAWTQPQRMKPPDQSVGKKVGQVIGVILLISVIVSSVLLARRNYRQGRGDREGAIRLATVVFVLLMGLWLLRSHLVPGIGTFGLLILTVSTALFISGLTFVLYLAVEPYVRRFWPHSIISWSRLLSGRVRDPLVGRDALLGVVLGVVWIALFKIGHLITMRMGSAPELFSTDFLEGARRALGAWLYQVPSAIVATLQFFFLALGLKIVLRRDWLAAPAFVALFTALKTLGADYPRVDIPLTILIYSIAVLIMYRFGLVSLACAAFTVDLLANVPFTTDVSIWYMSTSIFALLSVFALAIWGFYTSLGGEPLWKPDA